MVLPLKLVCHTTSQYKKFYFYGNHPRSELSNDIVLFSFMGVTLPVRIKQTPVVIFRCFNVLPVQAGVAHPSTHPSGQEPSVTLQGEFLQWPHVFSHKVPQDVVLHSIKKVITKF